MKSWLRVIVMLVCFHQSSTQLLAADGIALDLASPTVTKYATFLTSIRDDVRDPKLVDGGCKNIPVIGVPTSTFLRIDLTVSTGTVSLGLNRSDLYVVTYLAKNDKNVYRAYYFDRQITSAQLDKLFPEAKGTKNQQKITEYKESYASLEGAANQTRKKAGLGIGKLVTYIGGVNGKARKVQDEARFIMNAVQMVSEATRFGYIEKAVGNHFPEGFTPDDKVIILERNWARISEAIKRSNNGVFRKPIELKVEGATTSWSVSKAKELEMGILKYLGNADTKVDTFVIAEANKGYLLKLDL